MDVRRILVIGAGTMGHGIAQVAAQSGYEVSLFDAMEGAAAGGLEKVRKSFEKGIEKGKVSPADRDAALARISLAADLASGASDADLVVEAVPERLELKQAIFAEVGAAAPRPSKLLLGCTHYPLLLPGIRALVPPEVEIIDQAAIVAERLADWLRRHPEMESRLARGGGRRFATTDDPAWFAQKGERILGAPLRVDRARVPA